MHENVPVCKREKRKKLFAYGDPVCIRMRPYVNGDILYLGTNICINIMLYNVYSFSILYSKFNITYFEHDCLRIESREKSRRKFLQCLCAYNTI